MGAPESVRVESVEHRVMFDLREPFPEVFGAPDEFVAPKKEVHRVNVNTMKISGRAHVLLEHENLPATSLREIEGGPRINRFDSLFHRVG